MLLCRSTEYVRVLEQALRALGYDGVAQQVGSAAPLLLMTLPQAAADGDNFRPCITTHVPLPPPPPLPASASPTAGGSQRHCAAAAPGGSVSLGGAGG